MPVPTGSRQHIVPQMMIEAFAAPDGTLFELHKPSLTLGTRPRRPKGILFRDDYYKDAVSDFDGELLTPIEQRFRQYYPALRKGHTNLLGNDGGWAFIDWIASMMCRTPAFEEKMRAFGKAQMEPGNDDPLVRLAIQMTPAIAANEMRKKQFAEYRDWLTRPEWKWIPYHFEPDVNIVVTDHPVCMVGVERPGHLVTVVPMTRHLVIVGGCEADLAKCEGWSALHVNLILTAWAGTNIFCADKDALELIISCLRGDIDCDSPEWREAARKPFFGTLDRIAETGLPPAAIARARYEALKDRYGASMLR